MVTMKNKQEFISGPNIPVMEVQHNDHRRTIREATVEIPGDEHHESTVRRITHIAVKGAGGDLGNHYHTKEETFSVVNGDPTVYTAPKEEPTHITVREIPSTSHLVMEPGEVHTFRFEGPGDLISSMEGQFDPADTIPQPLDAPPDHHPH